MCDFSTEHQTVRRLHEDGNLVLLQPYLASLMVGLLAPTQPQFILNVKKALSQKSALFFVDEWHDSSPAKKRKRHRIPADGSNFGADLNHRASSVGRLCHPWAFFRILSLSFGSSE
jgi:hypothetical protein